MSYTFGWKIPNWEINKSEYEEVDSLPMMSSPVPSAIILIAYLSFVIKIGPIMMKGRKPFKLNNLLIVYNALQVIFSFYMMQRYFRYLLKTDFIQTKCMIKEPHYREEILSHMWIYYVAKVTELLDTVFFVLRKKYKQVTFLHIYHHSLMMAGSWLYIKYAPTENVVFIGFLNSLIHVFMYAYYGLAALGPEVTKYLTWKKYLTALQMVQFVSIFVQYLTSLKYTECPPSRGVAVFIIFNTFFFIYLFGNFYRQSYKLKENKAKPIINEKRKAKPH